MKKIFKWAGILLGILILIIVLAFISLIIFVNPNRYKPFIAERVMQYTGHSLIIDGDLSWTVFPHFGVKVNDLILQNPEGFKEKTFAKIDHMTIMVKLFPLIKHKIESSGITIDGMTLHFIKNTAGNENWIMHQLSAKAPLQKDPPVLQSHLEKAPFMIAIAGINVNDSMITYTDEQKDQTTAFRHFEFHAKEINLINAFPVTSTFDFSNPMLNARVTLKSNVLFNSISKIFAFKNIDLGILVPVNDKKYDVKISGDMTADLSRDTFQWSRAQIQLMNINLLGDVNVAHLSSAPVTGHFELQPLDMRETLKAFDMNLPNLQTFNPVSGDFDFSYGPTSFSLKGKLKADTLQFNQIKFTHLMVPLQLQAGVMTLSPISADFYQGKFDGTLKVIFNMALQTNLNAALTNFQMEPLLKDVKPNSKLSFTGLGNVNLNINSKGLTTNERLKNLNGQGHLSIANGVLKGIDIGKFINMAYAFAKKTPPFQETGQTDFGNLTGNFVIKDGIVANNDLLLNATQFTAKGQGTIDLNNQTILYHLAATLNNTAGVSKNSLLNLYGLAIPIEISGNLDRAKIGLDAKELTKALANGQLQNVESQIPIKIKGKAGKFLENLLR